MSHIHLDFKQQICLDLTVRGRGGIAIYLAVWLITTVSSGIEQTNPFFFYFNTFLMASIAVMRFVHYRLVMSRNLNTQSMYFSLVFLILIGALHWGILSAWVIFGDLRHPLNYTYMMLIVAFVTGGTAVLGISPTVRILYPLFISLPSVTIGIMIGGSENLVLVILLIPALLYIFVTSGVTGKDYRNAFYSQKEADNRARQMERLSITDQLTGLYNRLYFSKSYPQEWKRCSLLKIPLSVLLIDLDHFKRINDSYGHIVGDECLIKVANVFKSEMKREIDVVARYGGEEFIILLPDLDLRLATGFAKRLVQKIEQIELFLEGKPIYVSCSIGVASIVPEQILNNQSLIKAADDAMYEAKSKGRNQYCVAQELRLSIPSL
jgi:diguanylate cyclase (GGDEF)-like protein